MRQIVFNDGIIPWIGTSPAESMIEVGATFVIGKACMLPGDCTNINVLSLQPVIPILSVFTKYIT